MSEFAEYRFITESLDSKFDTVRNTELEDKINNLFPDRLFSSHTMAVHSDHMKKSGISVLRFMGKPLKQIEYHIHNENSQPGTITEPDRKAMLHSLKIIHDDAANQIKEHGRSIYIIHAANSEQYKKYIALGNRLANKHNYKVKELGQQPYTTDHSNFGPAFILREESEYSDFLGRKYKHIDEQLTEYNLSILTKVINE